MARRRRCSRIRACSRRISGVRRPTRMRWPRREPRMLAIEELTTGSVPLRAVDHVLLEVSEGSVMAVLGANGAGKTSLLRTLTGLVRPSSGRVALAGRDITRLPVEEIVRLGMARVPEGRGVVVGLAV